MHVNKNFQKTVLEEEGAQGTTRFPSAESKEALACPFDAEQQCISAYKRCEVARLLSLEKVTTEPVVLLLEGENRAG